MLQTFNRNNKKSFSKTNNDPSITIEKINIKNDTSLPKRMTKGSVGYDIFSPKDMELQPNIVYHLPLNFKILNLPSFLEIQVRSRSSMAKKGIIVPNSPGTIDSDYKDEVGILLLNLSNESYFIKKNDRIGQLVFNRFAFVNINNEKPTREFRRGGFGSSGRGGNYSRRFSNSRDDNRQERKTLPLRRKINTTKSRDRENPRVRDKKNNG